MIAGTEAHIIIDRSATRRACPLIELQALAGKAVALLACKPERVTAKIFRRPQSGSTFISVADSRHFTELFELRPQQPVVDFEIVNPPEGSVL